MQLTWTRRISLNAFNATAFSIFGILFLVKPTTWLPTLVLVLAAVAAVIFRDFRSQCMGLFSKSQYQWIARSFFAWFVVALLLAFTHSISGQFNFPENEIRMAIALTLLVMLATPSSRWWFLSGIALAGCMAFYWGVQAWPWTLMTRAHATTNNAIHFGNLSALVMLLSISVAFLAKPLQARYRVFFIMGAVGGFMGAASSLSRSSFVVLFPIVLSVFISRDNSFKVWAQRSLLALVISLAFGLSISSALRDNLRITETITDVRQMEQGNYMTSLGTRVAMWKTAWLIFKEHPLIGVGSGRFQGEISHRIEIGQIPKTEIHNQPHSDIMHALSSGGVIKFFAYLGILIAPFVFFYKRFRDGKKNSDERLMSVLGMQVVAAYFLTGLTNSNFDLQIYSTTYAVLVCVLAKLSSLDDSTATNATEPSKPLIPAAPSC